MSYDLSGSYIEDTAPVEPNPYAVTDFKSAPSYYSGIGMDPFEWATGENVKTAQSQYDATGRVDTDLLLGTKRTGPSGDRAGNDGTLYDPTTGGWGNMYWNGGGREYGGRQGDHNSIMPQGLALKLNPNATPFDFQEQGFGADWTDYLPLAWLGGMGGAIAGASGAAGGAEMAGGAEIAGMDGMSYAAGAGSATPWEIGPMGMSYPAESFGLSSLGLEGAAGSGMSEGSFYEKLMKSFTNQKDPLKAIQGALRLYQGVQGNKQQKSFLEQLQKNQFPHASYQGLAAQFADPVQRMRMMQSNPSYVAAQQYAQQAQARRNARSGNINSGYGDSLMASVLGDNASKWEQQMFGQISNMSGMMMPNSYAQAGGPALQSMYTNNLNTAGSVADALRSNQGFFPEIFKTFFN